MSVTALTTPQASLPQLLPARTSIAGTNPLLHGITGSVSMPPAMVAHYGAAQVAEPQPSGIGGVFQSLLGRLGIGSGTSGQVQLGMSASSAASAQVAATPTLAGVPGTQLPGGTVYSFADPNNAAMSGLAGIPPQLQQQLGMVAGQAEQLAAMQQQSQPQTNVTNQSSMGATGVGGAMGVPMLGAPIVVTPRPTTAPGDTATRQPASQSVTNRNSNEQLTQGDPYGWGGMGGMPYGGVATPNAPYGASMTGAYGVGIAPPTQGGITGFFSRLFG